SARGVDVTIADGLPRLTVDVGRLELALVNLFSNAIKYADPEKSIRKISVTGGVEGNRCWIAVDDNRIGIAPEALESIFAPFTRAYVDHADGPQVPGVGLGLSIVDECVRVMGGHVEARST